MTTEERGKVCDLIEATIAADGTIAPEERDFLQRVIERFGLSEAERASRPVASDPGRTTTTLRNMPADVQLRVMALLVEAAIVDGQVVPEERALLLASAATLGIEATALEERIARRLGSNVPFAIGL